MLKKERLQWILEKVSNQGIITVNDIIQELGVSDMTVRRDLDELDKEGLLIRIHGGAQGIDVQKQKSQLEKSNSEKHELQIEEKKEIAHFAAQLVADGETIFIGPGTTLEHFASEMVDKNIRVITNSLPVFEILKDSSSIDLLLIGGEYRAITGAFVGSLASNNVSSLTFSKAFVSANAISKNAVATYSDTEGLIQKLALDRAVEKYLLVDHHKFNSYDFYVFYETRQFDYVITDSKLPEDVREDYQTLAKVILSHPSKP